MFAKDRTGGDGFRVPQQRRSEATATRHRIVAARSSAVVLEREGEVDRAAALRAEADQLEALESSAHRLGELLPVRVRVRRTDDSV